MKLQEKSREKEEKKRKKKVENEKPDPLATQSQSQLNQPIAKHTKRFEWMNDLLIFN